jgi:hypothetical protein
VFSLRSHRRTRLTLIFLITDKTLQFEALRVLDALGLGVGSCAAVRVAPVRGGVLSAALCFGFFGIDGIFFCGPGVDGVDVEEDVDNWIGLVLHMQMGGMANVQRNRMNAMLYKIRM